jgi:hypothetical protein
MRTISILCVSLGLLVSCESGPPPVQRAPDTQAVDTSLTNINKAADTIDALAAPTVPAVKEHTDTIRNESGNVSKENKKAAALVKDDSKNLAIIQDLKEQAVKDKAKYENAAHSLVNKFLAYITGLCVLGIIVGVLTRSIPIIAAAISGIVACGIAAFIFQWAWAIALGVGALFVAYMGFEFWRKHKTVVAAGALLAEKNTTIAAKDAAVSAAQGLAEDGARAVAVASKAFHEVVQTAQVAKEVLARHAPDAAASIFTAPESVARQLQSESTQSLVKSILPTLPTFLAPEEPPAASAVPVPVVPDPIAPAAAQAVPQEVAP